MDTNLFSLVITGEWPGAGQSTTASMLAEKLHFSRVYAGFLFRKFAHVWKLEQKKLTWYKFEQAFAEGKISLDDYSFTEADFNESTLHAWQLQLKSVQTPDVWDKIIDRQSLIALQKPGVVVEAKVGVLLDETNLLPPQKVAHQIYKFLLVCPPEISAHRDIKRKIQNGEISAMDQHSPEYLELVRETTTETINRHLRDWERYETIYGIYRSNIYKPDIIQVHTAEKTKAEVVNTILNIINQKQAATLSSSSSHT
jgi:cytidylate kinase